MTDTVSISRANQAKSLPSPNGEYTRSCPLCTVNSADTLQRFAVNGQDQEFTDCLDAKSGASLRCVTLVEEPRR